ncbi:histidine kinase [Lentimicrobium saccharophilum]|uniref:Histidine kinase n=1 Tax=Lentimicrobium saccharophilum TaxID=1678841 RepID=A0A0S7BQ81_9BACT|nr:histidine kinase [Lentimicrobium saccharophilum]GAP42901.1 histidine kinase [Lentimicrobium saccharophilum]
MTSAPALTDQTHYAGEFSGIFPMQLSGERLSGDKAMEGSYGIDFILLPLKQSNPRRMTGEILKKPLLRVSLFVLLSIPLRLMLDLSFGMIYRFYEVIRPWQEYLGAALLTVAIPELVFLLKHRINRHIPWEKSPTRRLALECLIIGFTGLVAIVSLRIIVNLLLLKPAFIKFSDEAFTAIYYLFFLVLLPAFLEFAVFLLNRWRIGLAEVERFRKENAEFRFEALRAQINPHFLFNSLNTLSSLIYEDREKAAHFIRHLSDVYRYVLENRNRETITLGEELTFIKAFVYLYQLRFDNKLIISLKIEDALMHRLIAPMTLQLLIENAVKHNIVSAKRPLNIDIFAENNLYLNVRNNLQKKQADEASTAMGLKNIVSRYGFLTPHPVEINESDTEFIVKVPLI